MSSMNILRLSKLHYSLLSSVFQYVETKCMKFSSPDFIVRDQTKERPNSIKNDDEFYILFCEENERAVNWTAQRSIPWKLWVVQS
jgi:hypothetical protein